MRPDGVAEIRRLLEPYPTVRLSVTPTPIHALDRISKRLGRGPRLFVKRDDLTGFALGGNKVRKLDYLVADALAKEADTLVVSNASSFSRNAAAAGKAFGLEVHVLVAGDEARHNVASRSFFATMDAKLHYVANREELASNQRTLADALRNSGRRVVELHPGGSDTIGTLGYLEAFAEIAAFSARQDIFFDRIYVASGSAATQAGLVLGLSVAGFEETRVMGIAVSQRADVQTKRVADLAQATAKMLGIAFDVSSVIVDDRFLGDGYPIPSVASRAAVDAFAKDEGILLDPIYAGKAAAGLLAHARDGELTDAANVLLLHTGGNGGAYY